VLHHERIWGKFDADPSVPSVMASCQLALRVRKQAGKVSVPRQTTNLHVEKSGGRLRCMAGFRCDDKGLTRHNHSYVAALELRIEKLERRLAYARSRKASVALHEQDTAPDAELDRKDSLATIKAAIHRNAARKRENSDINSLVSDFGYL
jgi:hypothetical protein